MSVSPPKTLVIVDSRRGGTGKTTCAMLMMEACAGHLGVRGYDFAGEGGDLCQRYGAVPITPGSGKNSPFFVVADALLHPTSDLRVAIIDVGGLQDDAIERFLDECGIAHLARDGELRIVFAWVCDTNPYVMRSLSNAMQIWESRNIPAEVVLIRNEGRIQDVSELAYVTQCATGKALQAAGAPVVALPRLEGMVMQAVQMVKMPFTDFVSLEEHGGQPLSRSSRLVAKGWLATCVARLSALPFLAPLAQPHDGRDSSMPAK